MTKVVHIATRKKYDVYIGRPSKWGNPFTHKEGTKAKFVLPTREEAIEAYRKWITEGDGKHLLSDLHELKGKTLGCWCSPQPCHGDILAELADKLYVTKYQLEGECEIDIDTLVKVWDNRFFINQYNSPVSNKNEYRLIEYVKDFEEQTRTKVTISESQAKEIIKALNLVPLRDIMFANNIGWQTEERLNRKTRI